MDFFSLLQNYTLLAGASALIIALYILPFMIPKTTKHIPVPQASGAWPIVGHLNLFNGSSDLPHRALATMAVKYGPIFTVRLGIHRVLMVNSWQVAKEIFTTHDVIISNRPKYLASKILGYNNGMFGFTPYGPYWREMRRIISLELLSNRRLEKLKHVRISELDNSIKNLYELWREKRDDQRQVLVEMKKWFGEFNINVILRMVVGKRYSGAASSEEEEEMKRSREVMRNFFHFLGLFVAADALPFLGWLDLGGHEKAMKKVAQEIDSMAEKWLHEHRSKRNSCESVEEKDFMDVLISAVDSSEGLTEYDSDTIIKSATMVLIASSADTTTVMLTWALSLLLNNSHSLKKTQEELDLVVGRDRQVNESDITNLVYLQAVVKETLRLYPAGRLGGLRQFSEDCTVAGYHVPKGTWLMVNLWKLQQDPEIWSNPLEFKPERFLDENHKHVDVIGSHFELIPFGAGRRCCPGISLALQVLHLVLATLLQNFDISTPGGAPVDMTEAIGMTNAKVSPLEVLISPRMSSTTF
ncbi:cytochrome P450 CYP82D47-like [Bidens hawaiensis]|uniref:cytochrome P450 CYP82D47-like n=1 Tax=Bidens hawaiensis TaxID=980011 RepID=UPI0040491E7A